MDVASTHVWLSWKDHITLDERFVRPPEVDLLIGDPARAKADLGREPKVGIEQLVQMMVDADLERLEGTTR